MKQGIQNEFKDINNDIYEYGCYFLDLLEWAARDNNTDFTMADITKIHSVCKKAGYVGDECYINNAAEVYNMAAALKKYKSVDKVPNFIKADKMPDTYIICNKKPMHAHFTLCYKGEKWDSLPPTRPGAARYQPDSYRVLV
jgi:hypothetical protein